MKRRQVLSLGLGALALAACGGRSRAGTDEADPAPGSPPPSPGPEPSPPVPVAVASAEPAFARRAEVPGFQDLGPWLGEGPAPLLLQLRLNINDFMRPELEAQAVHRWLDKARDSGLSPTELSFTGQELLAFQRAAPALITRIRELRPAIYQHYRLQKARRSLGTDYELYATDPATMQLDRSQHGPCLLLQKTFGVTPADEGGVLGELLRRAWSPSAEERHLRALGLDRLGRQDQVAHPNRILSWALPDVDAPGGSDQIEAYLRIRRLEGAIARGAPWDDRDLEARLADLLRWAQVATEMGFDLSGIVELAGLVDLSRLREFRVGVFDMDPTASELERMRAWAAKDLAGLRATLARAMEELARRTLSVPTIAAELRARMDQLSAGRVYAVRLAWHASNDYSLEPWAQFMKSASGGPPHPLTPAHVRSDADRAAIVAAVDSVFDTFAADPRVREASLYRQTQWDPANSADAGYRSVFGLSLDRVPVDLTASQVDARARAAGIEVPVSGRSPGAHPEGGRPAGGRPPGGRPPGGRGGSR